MLIETKFEGKRLSSQLRRTSHSLPSPSRQNASFLCVQSRWSFVHVQLLKSTPSTTKRCCSLIPPTRSCETVRCRMRSRQIHWHVQDLCTLRGALLGEIPVNCASAIRCCTRSCDIFDRTGTAVASRFLQTDKAPPRLHRHHDRYPTTNPSQQQRKNLTLEPKGVWCCAVTARDRSGNFVRHPL